MVARKKKVVRYVNVNVMRKVQDKRKRKKHHDVKKAAVAFSQGVHTNVLVERT